VLGVTTSSGIPHSTATGGAGSAGLTYPSNDAWSNNLQVGALNAIGLGAGVTLPIGQNLGVETQYGRATTTGVATGASGLLTDNGGGLVSLGTATGTTPGVGSISLATALTGTIGDKLAGKASQLVGASLDVGAVGSVTSLDSCNALWQGISDATAVARSYMIAKLGLNFSSSLVGTVTTDASSTVTGLSTALNLLQPVGTTVSNSTITTALTSALSNAGLTIGGPTTVKVGIAFNLALATALLTSTIASGPVSINLGTGQISADIAGLGDFADLNSLPANTPLIDATTLSALSTHIADAVNTFISGPFTTALTNALNSATVTVNIGTHVTVLGIDAASLTIGISGSVGQFLDPVANGQPMVSVSDVDTAGAAGLLALLGVNLDALLGTVIGNLTAPLLSGVVPAIASTVVTPTIAAATADIGAALSTLSGTTLPPVLASLGAVVTVVGDAVQLTVNAQPDQTNPVGSPETAAAGRFFESALKVGVLNTSDASSSLALYLGSSSAGPNAEN
jgi:hypothetical protein